MHRRIRLEAGGLDASLHHPQAAEGEDRSLEWLVGLKSYDDLIVAVDVAGLVGEQGGRRLGIDRQNALFPFVSEVWLQFRPNGLGALRCAGQEVLAAGVRRNVADDEVANVDRSLPIPGPEAPPAISGIDFLLDSGTGLHDRSPTACILIEVPVGVFDTACRRRRGGCWMLI